MKKIKLWITDIDGTIMNYDGSYTKEMYDIIKKMEKIGVYFVLATGRMFMGADFVAQKFNLNSPVICYQGAVVRTKDEILWQAPIKNTIAKEVVSYLKKKNLHIHVYNNDVLYVDDDNKKIMSEYCDNRGTTYQVVNSLEELKLDNVPKILCVIEDNNLMQKIKNDLSEKYKNKLTIVQSSPIYLEINDINASKGNALNFLKKYWNITKEEILASGDQDNDIEMLKEAGIKVAVGNNSKELLKIADFHCKNVDSNELVKIIERYTI